VTIPKVSNKVFNFDLLQSVNFSKFVCNRDFSYEAELFPAALISRWRPAHVTLFPCGKGLVTGITTAGRACDIICDISNFLERHARLSG
jgi:TATA-box binding protein (TBP) (component of TFIID and TFIIIB)